MPTIYTQPGLTRNQSLVMRTLLKAHEPLSAYAILEYLHKYGFRAPPQVYRALDKLVEYGMVHRLESLSAFVACQQPDCEKQALIAFTICDECNQVDEILDTVMAQWIKKLAKKTGFISKKLIIELQGICHNCQAD